jgi:hypothetical protein
VVEQTAATGNSAAQSREAPSSGMDNVHAAGPSTPVSSTPKPTGEGEGAPARGGSS